MKKTRLFLVLLALLCVMLLLFVHSRTPFFLQEGGPWSVGYGFTKNGIPEVVPDSSRIYTAEMLRKHDTNSRFLADPFFVKQRDSFYIFFEYKHFTPHKANIGVLTSADGLKYHFGGVVLDEPFHLSYPQVFSQGKQMYMVPESAQAKNVLLYTTDAFPKGWRVCDTLVRGSLKDPSLYLSDTLNIMVASDDKLSLYLYKADSLRGEWKKVKRILRGSEARAGGRIFEYGKQLYLPVQDCSHGYGSSLSLYRFDFSGSSAELVKVREEFLHAFPGFPQFAFGMHQFDIQKVDGEYYYVYDGNRIGSTRRKQAIWYASKLSFNDFMNLFR